MRRHGWQLPYHPLQVVAVAVFLALMFAFYVFFAPFVGTKILEIIAIALFTPTVVAVVVLYIWCVAKDPADPAVLNSKKLDMSSHANNKLGSTVKSSTTNGKVVELTSGSQAERQLSSSHYDTERADALKENLMQNAIMSCFGFLYAKVTQAIEPCITSSNVNMPAAEIEMLYCSLCKAEISIRSKHCRVCDKCVDGFDHHCRWLNNCVGKKNYTGFFALMVSGLIMLIEMEDSFVIGVAQSMHPTHWAALLFRLQLISQWSVGLWVVIHYFLNLRFFEDVIASKLGSSFSPVAYVVVVAMCTILALTATYPLGQLLCFHLLLIKKGITTYDYIVAMREQEQKAAGEFAESPITSPVSSMGTASAASSAAGLQGRAWCTPPRFFFDHEGVYPSEPSSSPKDVSSGVSSKASVEEHYRRKTSVRISPWALASLNKEDVLRSARQARNRSSVLRPIASVDLIEETDSSNASSSVEFHASTGDRSASKIPSDKDQNYTAELHMGNVPSSVDVDTLEQVDGSGIDSGDEDGLVKRGRKVLNPLQREARNAFNASHAFSMGGIIASSPDSNGASPEVPELSHSFVVPMDKAWMQRCGTDTPGNTGQESADGSASAKSVPCTPNAQVVVAVHHSL